MNNTGVTMLSILTASIPERHSIMIGLYGKLHRQMYEVHTNHEMLGEIEWILDESPSFINGGLSIGKKRESLVRRAKGKYLCFLDDDEDIAPNYVETLVRLCQHDMDVCTFKAIAKNDNFWSIIDMSIYNPNIEASPNYVTLRSPWHVCPIRSSFAKMFDFEDINYGEDIKWMEKVLTQVTSEARSTAVLLQYNHSNKHSEADKITKHVQSK